MWLEPRRPWFKSLAKRELRNHPFSKAYSKMVGTFKKKGGGEVVQRVRRKRRNLRNWKKGAAKIKNAEAQPLILNIQSLNSFVLITDLCGTSFETLEIDSTVPCLFIQIPVPLCSVGLTLH